MKHDALVSSIENSDLVALPLINILCVDFLTYLRGKGEGVVGKAYFSE